MEIGQKIRKARLERGMTQQELGTLVGVQKSAIAKYENGKVVNIKRSTLQKIASALSIRPSELIFTESPKDAADLHVRIITDFELMDALKDYYTLSAEKQRTIRELIAIYKQLEEYQRLSDMDKKAMLDIMSTLKSLPKK